MTTAFTLDDLQWLDDQHQAMLDLVLELSNLNSGTLNLAGLAQVRQRLSEEFGTLGGVVTERPSLPWSIVDEQGVTRSQELAPSLLISRRPECERRVLLCIHMDTVYGAEHPFQQCRQLPNGHINGPGVADAKGGLVVMLYALKMLEASRFSHQLGWDVLINPDEEIGSPGSRPVIDELARQNDFGLLFEPALADGRLVSWRKGSGNFALVVRGRAAHAGRAFADGRNAIAAAAGLATAIDGLNTDPEVTFNLGRIRGGAALNVVPDLAILRINIRVLNSEQQRTAESKLRDLAHEFSQGEGIEVELHGEFSSPPKPLDDATVLLQRRIERCGQLLGEPIAWSGTGGASDGNKFFAAGLPNIDSLGPQGGRIHSDEEFLIPTSLVTKAKLAAAILMDYANETKNR